MERRAKGVDGVVGIGLGVELSHFDDDDTRIFLTERESRRPDGSQRVDTFARRERESCTRCRFHSRGSEAARQPSEAASESGASDTGRECMGEREGSVSGQKF